MSKDKTPTPLNTSIILERIISRLDRLEEVVNLNGHDESFNEWWGSLDPSWISQRYVSKATAREIWNEARKDI